MAWPGGKDGAGVYQRLINQIPPHDLFISPFLGDCAVMRRKLPAAASIGIDKSRSNIERWSRDRSIAGLRLYNCCGIEWLKHRFDLYHLARATPDSATAAAASEISGEGLGIFVYKDPP